MSEQEEKLPLKEELRMLFKASKGFWLVNVVNFGDGIAYFGILNLMTLFLGVKFGMGMPDDLVGWSVSWFTGLVTLFMFGGGFVSDRIGVRRALTMCLGILLASRLMLVLSPYLSSEPLGQLAVLGTNILFSPSFMLCWFGLFLMAFAEGVLQPALYAGVKEYTDARTAAMSYSILYAIMNFGIMVESFISPYIRSSEPFLKLGGKQINGLGFGVSGVFWVCIVATAIMLLVNICFFTKKVEDRDRVVDEIEKTPENAVPKTFVEKLKELPFLDSRFIFFIFALLPVRTLFAHQWLTMPDYIMRCFPPEVGAKYEWIAALNPIMIVIFVPLIAACTRKVSVITMMIIGTTISALTTFLLVPGPNLALLLTYVTVFSIGEAVWSSRFLEYVADIAPTGRVGAYMGLAGIPWFLAKFTTGLYSGKMLSIFVPVNGTHDSSTMWLIYACIACITPVVLVIAKKWLTSPLKRIGEA